MLPEILEKYNVLEDEKARELGVLPLIEKAFKGESVILPVVQYDASVTMENLGVKDAGGNKPYIHMRMYPIKNDNGEVVNVVAIEEDMTRRKLAEMEIQQYQDRLKALASQLTLTEEKERRTIAADLHDHVGHSLALARMQLESIPEAKSELEKNILVKDVSSILLTALQDTRNLISELSSPSMHEIGLRAAVAEYLEEQIAKHRGLNTEFVDEIGDAYRKILADNMRALLFRNVRELLVNVVKHARANKVRVHFTEVAGGVKISVEDDGVGFDPGAEKAPKGPTGGFGLFSIQERMADMGGSCAIQSEPGRGCRVTLTVPIK
jgi:signal transduction histidine kinase